MAISNKNALSTFLKKYTVDKGKPYSHTRIGNKELNIYGGKYLIPKEKSNEFYRRNNREWRYF